MHIGPYEVLEEVAKGGMGVVYRARDPRLNRDVALKVLLRSDDPLQTQRLIREAESLARLRHPSIVRVHAVEEHQGRPVLVLEWIDGESLQRRLRGGPLAPRAAAELARSLAEALAYAHGQGVLHRDLKPGNVLIDERGEPKLTDFGIARLQDEAIRLSKTGAIIGSPEYWAPEQAGAERDQVGAWTDVYGLGGTLYAALTGKPPFQGATMMELAVAAARWKPAPPGVDATLDAICLRCLEKEPTARFESAADLADALEDYLAGAPTGAGRGLIVGLLGAALALAIGLAVAIGSRDGPASPERSSSPPNTTTTTTKTADVAGVASKGTPEPSLLASWLARGRARYDRNDLRGALAAAEKAVALAPDSVEALGLRGLIHSTMGRRLAAQRDIDRVWQLTPDSAEAWYLRAVLHYQAKRPLKSLAALNQTLARDPSHVRALCDRSISWQELGKLGRAEADIRKAISIQPKVAKHRMNLGSFLVRRARLQEAIAEYDRALDLDPKYFDALRSRAHAHARLGDRAAAARDFRRAISLEPEHVGGYHGRAHFRAGGGDHAGAVEDYGECLRRKPAYLPALVGRAESLIELRRFDAAERDIGEALRRVPNMRNGMMLRTKLELARGRSAEALRWADRTVRAYPKHVPAYYLRSEALFKLRRLKACIPDCTRVIESNLERRLRLYSLNRRARCRAALWQLDLAIVDAKRFLRMVPPGSPDRRGTELLLAFIQKKKQELAERKRKTGK